MLLKSFYALCFALLISCGSNVGYRLKSTSNNVATTSPLTELAVINASILHVDLKERIVTIKSIQPITTDFYLTADNQGQTTSALKIQNSRQTSLYIADILEGSPGISDTLIKASEDQKEELSVRYTDAEVD
jgi:hypothetical protein